MANEIRMRASLRDDASKPIQDIHDAWVRLQKRGAEGFIAGATAAATLKAFDLMGQGVRDLTGFFGDSVRAAIEEEAGIKRLGAALQANVPAWNGETKAIETVIRQREALAFSDDQLRASLAILVAATHDVGKAFEDQRAAMDLARLKGIDLQTASEALVRVEGGRFRLLASLGIQLHDNATKEEALAAVQKVAAGQAEAFGNTTAGAMEAAGIAVHNLQEEIGQQLAPAIKDAANFMRTDLIPALRDTFTVMGTVIDAGRTLADVFRDVTGAKMGEEAVRKLAQQQRDGAVAAKAEQDATEALNRSLTDLKAQFAEGQITEEEYRRKDEELTAAFQLLIESTNGFTNGVQMAGVEARNAAEALDRQSNAAIGLTGTTDTLTGSVLKLVDAADLLATTALPGQVAAMRNAQTGAGAVGAAVASAAATVTTATDSLNVHAAATHNLVTHYQRLGSAAHSASAATSKAAAEQQRAVHDAYERSRKEGDAYYEELHRRNAGVIDDAQKVARAKIEADHRATNDAIENAHKAANAQIEEAHRAANEQIREQRRAVEDALAEQRRLHAAPVTAAERAQRDIENARRQRDLNEELAAAKASGDEKRIRQAQEDIQSFQAELNIEFLRDQQAMLDEQADKDAKAAQEQLDARQKAEDEAYQKRRADEDALYGARIAAEDTRYKARVAAEEAFYARKKADEDARFALQKTLFDEHIDALEKSKKANVGLADIETLRFLQEQVRQLKEEKAPAASIALAEHELEAFRRGHSHAAGLFRVPYDDYPAFLHRDEMVLPAGEAAGLRGGGVNLAIAPGAIVIHGGKDDADAIATKVLYRIQREMTRNGYSSLSPR